MPVKEQIVSYEKSSNTLSFYHMKLGLKGHEMQLENVSKYNYEKEDQLKEWIKKWFSFIHLRDEISREIKFVNCMVYFDRVDIHKIALDIFGYPICDRDRVKIDDPYYIIYDKCEVSDEIKELLREYLIREGIDAIYIVMRKERGLI